MTSLRQIESNRRNAQKSTGPKTDTGKQRASRNAVRHGLTAETVIKLLEDPDDYRAFEMSVTADYDPETAVERELVLRLASLLWRLRRATSIETGLLQIEYQILPQRDPAPQTGSAEDCGVIAIFPSAATRSNHACSEADRDAGNPRQSPVVVPGLAGTLLPGSRFISMGRGPESDFGSGEEIGTHHSDSSGFSLALTSSSTVAGALQIKRDPRFSQDKLRNWSA
jgi:hypothetical protein